MKKTIILWILLLSTDVLADLSDCQNIYVGRVWVEKGLGFTGVVFLDDPTSVSGSYWVRFTGWTESERKEAQSLLMMAKASQHRVNLVTEDAGGCGIQAGFTEAKSVYLSTNP